jgi:hypothetical protein
MPEFVVGNTEPGCSKLKRGKGFSKPNFELGPNWGGCLIPRMREKSRTVFRGK